MRSSNPTIGLVQFPGSNCDQDCFDIFKRHFDINVVPIWHTEPSLPKIDGLIIPGGFSYGDYLRSGSLASHSRIMESTKQFVAKGGSVIGICNGFQILAESRLLPGVLLKNATRNFICKYVHLKVVPGKTTYQHVATQKRTLAMPIAHGEGRYYADTKDLKSLWDNGRVVVQYADVDGNTTADANPNGSLDSIAGIVNETGKVFGLMPHPERATDKLTGGSDDGLWIWRAFLKSI